MTPRTYCGCWSCNNTASPFAIPDDGAPAIRPAQEVGPVHGCQATGCGHAAITEFGSGGGIAVWLCETHGDLLGFGGFQVRAPWEVES